jgi:hypothetical protein
MGHLLPVLDPLGSGTMGLFVLAWLEALGLAALSIGATCLFVFTGARPKKADYVVAIACFGLSHGVLLRHSLEWWRALPVLSVLALLLIANAPSLRKERDERLFKSGSRDQRSAPENPQWVSGGATCRKYGLDRSE